MNRLYAVMSNIQILSALIWACTIIACSLTTDSRSSFIVLITAAGFHVVLLAQSEKKNSKDALS